MRILAFAAAVLALAPPGLALLGAPPGFSAEPVALDPSDRAHVRVGALTYLGGWVLKSGDRRFGGISSMTVQGGRFAAVSDTGMLFWLRPSAGGVTLEGIQRLPAGPRGDSVRKEDRDSESSAYDPATGRTWVGFENANEIWRYGPGFAEADAHAAPKLMAGWPENAGAEAMIRLRDGRFFVFEENVSSRRDGAAAGILFDGDPTAADTKATPFGYRAPDGFSNTDAIELPDGRVLMLHRRFSLSTGAEAALTLFDPRTIKKDTAIAGKEIARFSPPLTVDNMEALAFTQEGGRLILWIASDDNFSPAQRTLLMRYALDPKA